jgi:hypothetical protein
MVKNAVRVSSALLCVVWCAAAEAQGRARLDVRGSSSCIDAQVLHARIAHYLGGADIPRALAIQVDLTSKPARFRLLRAGRVAAERHFERVPDGCAEWRDTIALAVAVAIEHSLPPLAAASRDTGDAERVRPAPTADRTQVEARTPAVVEPASEPRAPQAERAPQARPEPAREPSAAPEAQPKLEAGPRPSGEPSSEPETHSPQRPRPTERWMLHVGGAYLLEALPAPAAALRIGGEYSLVPALRIGLSALMSARVEVPFEDGRVQNQLFGSQLTACVNTPILPVLLLGCAGTSAGYVRASGLGYTRGLRADMFWLGALVRTGIELPATSTLALRIAADARANLLRPELRLKRQNAAQARRAISPIGGSLTVDLVLRLD